MVSRTDQSAGRRKDRAPGIGRTQERQTRRAAEADRVGSGAPDSLRLVRPPLGRDAEAGGGTPAIEDPTDPRWVLAVRAAEQLEGTLLSPEKRDRLIRLGRMLGLSAFDCNLVIAIVQDQARRGVASERCPAAGMNQLALVAEPARRPSVGSVGQQPLMLAGLILMGLILAEVALGFLIF